MKLNKFKSAPAIILALGLSTLVGCTGSSSTATSEETTGESMEQSTQMSTTEAMSESSAEAPMEDVTLTLYSTRHYDTDDEIFARFTADTGIKVEVVKGKDGELLEKLTAEGEDTPADIFYTSDAGNLFKAKEAGLFQAIGSETVNKNIPENLRDKDDMWTGITKRARVIVYSKDRVDPSALSTYEDLADPKWAGKILVRSSSSQYNVSLVASFIETMGEEKTKEWLEGFVHNFAREPQGNDRDQGKAIYAQEGDIAIMNTYYLGKMLNDNEDQEMKMAGENIAIFFPNQETTGTHVNISGAGIISASKNKEAAVKFLEFLTSEETQEEFSALNYEFPANPSVEVQNEFLKSLGEFKSQDINLTVLGENSKKASQMMDEAGWK